MAESTPSVIFTAERTMIQSGESVTIRWHVEGVKEVYFFVDGEDWHGHGVAGVDERQVRPAKTTTYRLRVVRLDNGVDVRGVEIHIQEQARPPLTHSFSVDKTEIQIGDYVTFSWHVEGVKEVYFFAENEGWQGHGVAGEAEQQVCPGQTTIYRLRVVGSDNAVEEHGIEVRVRAANRIFTVDRALIQPGECVTFRWHVEGVKAVYFHAEDEPWHEHGVAGVAEEQVCLSDTTTYCLRVVKADDSLEAHYMTVTVSS
jgi:hypothetical protein